MILKFGKSSLDVFGLCTAFVVQQLKWQPFFGLRENSQRNSDPFVRQFPRPPLEFKTEIWVCS